MIREVADIIESHKNVNKCSEKKNKIHLLEN